MEKALKAVLLAYGLYFRKVHDIEYLIDRIREVYPKFPTFGIEAATLDQYMLMPDIKGTFEIMLNMMRLKMLFDMHKRLSQRVKI